MDKDKQKMSNRKRELLNKHTRDALSNDNKIQIQKAYKQPSAHTTKHNKTHNAHLIGLLSVHKLNGGH